MKKRSVTIEFSEHDFKKMELCFLEDHEKISEFIRNSVKKCIGPVNAQREAYIADFCRAHNIKIKDDLDWDDPKLVYSESSNDNSEPKQS